MSYCDDLGLSLLHVVPARLSWEVPLQLCFSNTKGRCTCHQLSSLGQAPYLFARPVLLQSHAYLGSSIRSWVVRLSKEQSSSIVCCVPTILDPSLLDLTPEKSQPPSLQAWKDVSVKSLGSLDT